MWNVSLVNDWTLSEAGDLVEKRMAYFFLWRFILSRGQWAPLLDVLFYLAVNEDLIWYIFLRHGQSGFFCDWSLIELDDVRC